MFDRIEPTLDLGIETDAAAAKTPQRTTNATNPRSLHPEKTRPE
jgi:hypothetical protein